MSGHQWLDGLILALSIFNTVVLLWLGLTTFLRAEHRVPGVWLVSGGFLAGGAVFLSQSVLFGLPLSFAYPGFEFWWRFAIVPLVFTPPAWYLAVLWYGGFWESGAVNGQFRREHRYGLLVVAATALVILAVFAAGGELPSSQELRSLQLQALPSINGIPILGLIYPFYIVAIMATAIYALLRPGTGRRSMVRDARRRARPWLIAASLGLFAVSMVVGGALFWIWFWNQGVWTELRLIVFLSQLDILVTTLITFAILSTGQAIVAYEIFTGQIMPRRGLKKAWRRVLILAAGCSIVIAWSIESRLPQIYPLIGLTVIMTTFFALVNWRSGQERAALMRELQPLVLGSSGYDSLLQPGPSKPGSSASDPELPLQAAFAALAQDVLAAESAFLVPQGPTAQLVDRAFSFPDDGLSDISVLEQFPDVTEITRLDGRNTHHIRWLIPLNNTRGRSGTLLLGPKSDRGLYVQEEIDIARSVAERLLEHNAGLELARRLVRLQQRNMEASQVVDQRTRRELHDEVLPVLHAAALSLDAGHEESAAASLAEAHQQISALLHRMPLATRPEYKRLGLLAALRDQVQAEYATEFSKITWHADEGAERALSALSTIQAEVVYYAAREIVRNAARHAGTPGRLPEVQITVSQENDSLRITIQDNGVGLPLESSAQAAGHGLDLHSTLMAVVGGWLAAESNPGEFTRVTLGLSDMV
jgi:signal transduction histidine kinase